MNGIKRYFTVCSIIAVFFTYTIGSTALVYADTVNPDGTVETEIGVEAGNNQGSSPASETVDNTTEASSDGSDSEETESGDTGNTEEGNGEEESGEEAELKSGAVRDTDGKWRYYEITGEGDQRTSAARTGTGWIKENGAKAYYMKNGVLLTGWQTIKYSGKNSYRYYFGGDGKSTPLMARGVTYIKGTPYYFVKISTNKAFGNLCKSKIITNSKGNLVYATSSTGRLRTGFIAYKYRCYYLSKKSNSSKGLVKYQPARNYKVNDNITIGSKGYIGGTRGKALYYGIKALNKNGWTLKSAYKYSYRLRYANRPYRPKTVAQGAVYGFSKGKGNCYVMNCCFHVMADLMGYKVRQIKGSVGPWRAPHSWLEIRQNGKWYVYDANFRNETGRNGFKIYYGKSGTWRYNRTSNYLKKY